MELVKDMLIPFLLSFVALATFVTPLSLWRNSAGQRVRFVFALLSLFFAGAGVFVAALYGQQTLDFAKQGGPMWFASVAMGCTVFVGLIFTGVFGFFSLRLFNRRLWLAGMHASMLAAALGAVIDSVWGRSMPLILPADGETAVFEMIEQGRILPLGFRFRVEKVEAGKSVQCHIERVHRGHREQLHRTLNLGESYDSKGWSLQLVGANALETNFSVTYAPAAPLQNGGLLGFLLCMGGVMFSRTKVKT